MKQTKSFDLLSELGRRSANISVIYVAPHADRESVFQAILTQEKLGREQMVMVLHNQNSAFQQPADFDLLKELQDDLHAMLIIVASPGTGPTKLAQQRGFPVYASLESYVVSLRREASSALPTPKTAKFPSKHPRKLIGVVANFAGKQKGILANVAQSLQEQPTHAPSIERTKNAPANNYAPVPMNLGKVEGDLNAIPEGGQILRNAHASGLGRAGDAMSLAVDGLSGTDSGIIFPGGYEEETPLRQLSDDEYLKGFPSFLERNTPKLPAVSSKITRDLPSHSSIYSTEEMKSISALSGAQGQEMKHTPTMDHLIVPLRDTGSLERSSKTRLRPHRKPRWHWLIASALTILALLIVVGGMAYAGVGMLGSLRMSHTATPTSRNGGALLNSSTPVSTPATPALTAAVSATGGDLKGIYTITAVTGTPGSNQVQASIVSSTQQQSATMNTTGQGHAPATTAMGKLTFQNNGAFTHVDPTYQLTDGTIVPWAFSGQHNVPVTFVFHPQDKVFIAANSSITVRAQAVNPGTSGNIPANDILNRQCCGNTAVSVSNGPFTGGQDAQSYMFVQQSDIDRAANPLRTSSMQSAQNGLATKKQANEQFVGSPHCTPNVTSDHNANDRATNVTVTVSTTCTQEAYNQDAAKTLANTLLTQDGNRNPKFTGDTLDSKSLKTNIISATVAAGGIVSIQVSAEGTWKKP